MAVDVDQDALNSPHEEGLSQGQETGQEQPAPDTKRRFWQRLFDPVDNGWLVYFRILFGFEMLYTVYKHFDHGRVLWYSEAPFLFKYYGFEWVHAWPGEWLKVHYIVLGVLSVFIMLGLFYRLSMTLFFFGFTYVYLLDQADYLNHYYLVCLITLVMIFIPAHHAFSLDALFRPKLKSKLAPAWALWLLRIQIGIPYFFGGIAKLNADWLRGQPMRTWLAERTDRIPLLADFFVTKEAAYFFSYGGMLYDLLIVPMLIWKRTRLLGYTLTIFFHLTNTMLFNIGIFPWLMLLASLIFFPPRVPRKIMSRLLRVNLMPAPSPGTTASLNRRQRYILAILGGYLAFQFLFPFRHWLYPGHVSWTEAGHRFAWHMMLRTKRGTIDFFAFDPHSKKAVFLDPTGYLSFEQRMEITSHPDMIRQFAEFLANEPRMKEAFQKHGLKDVEIRVDSWVTLNGRYPQRLIDPNVDISKQPRQLGNRPWVIPLTEPFRYEDPFGIGNEDWYKFLATKPAPEFK